MADIDFPEDLIALERSAWEEIQAGQLTVATAQAVHDAIGAYVARDDVDATRLDVEMGLKKIVRHPEAAG